MSRRHRRRRGGGASAPLRAAIFAVLLSSSFLVQAPALAADATPAPNAARPTHHDHGAAHGGSRHDATARHSFDDVEHWVAVFDDPARDAWQKPEAVVGALALRPGMTVADLGAGTGYFSRHLAAAVGARGSVLAVDVEPALVEHLRRRAEREGTANVVPILASPDNPRLPAAGTDLVLIVDTFHHIDDRIGYAARIEGALRPGGRIAIIDWQNRDLPVGPDRAHKLPREQVIEEMTAAGYQLDAEPEVLPYQYFLVFTPASG